MFLVVHPVGNNATRMLIKAMSDSDALHSFHTSLAYHDGLQSKLLPRFVVEQLKRRSFPGIPKRKVMTYPYFNLARIAAQRLNFTKLVNNASGRLGVEKLYHYIDSHVANYIESQPNEQLSSVYGFDGKCLSTFRRARELGHLRLYYEAACGYTPHVAQVMAEEKELNPAWRASIPVIQQATIDRHEEELHLADHIIVASSIVKNDLIKHNIHKTISVVPYGSPHVSDSPHVPGSPHVSGSPLITETSTVSMAHQSPLNVMYVGSLSQQKGISYLFDAFKKVGGHQNLNITIVGQDYSLGRNKALAKHLKHYQWYKSAPNNQIIQLLKTADILVLPSLTEAFGLVVLEALSQGTAVIVSDQCGASDLIVHGSNGYVVPVRCSDAIAEKLTVLDQDRDQLRAMKLAAIETARTYSWQQYAESIRHSLGIEQNDFSCQ
ncbi:glycosyltransferase family 4 protein [Photobacterium atrarenae]|uniref:Glycosyltransferase family 4 protein n=1 Tax=Photobacterium atrarenae TaxID=865757 RepID=A0ABY5GNT1_9GAMM|nr:glycosyltransferase family 4 protein [Photobacterium atrarenae]UTV30460.1 glycosyltransferase family 4 protein [Photobacterium atrarenae]